MPVAMIRSPSCSFMMCHMQVVKGLWSGDAAIQHATIARYFHPDAVYKDHLWKASTCMGHHIRWKHTHHDSLMMAPLKQAEICWGCSWGDVLVLQ